MISDLVFGGITGLVGGALQKLADYKTKKLEVEDNKLKRDHEERLRKLDSEIMAQEWAQRTKVAEVEADVRMYEASQNEPELYSAAVKPTKGQGWILVALDALRGSVRPLLTLYLCGVTTFMYAETDGGTINPQTVVDTILYLTTVCVGWWFASRGGKK